MINAKIGKTVSHERYGFKIAWSKLLMIEGNSYDHCNKVRSEYVKGRIYWHVVLLEFYIATTLDSKNKVY